jgi:hypothetical membrane protein
MRPVPWWGVLSASCAPVFLIGGWTLAASRQPPGYDPVVGTISALAARGAADRWVMTGALAALGTCHAVTALGLRPAAPRGRFVLAAGGIATMLVAVFPQPDTGASVPHAVAAGVAFSALAVWPALSSRQGADTPVGLRPAVAVTATVVLAGLAVWFTLQLHGGTRVGLAERVLAGAQALWPLFVTTSAYRYRRPATTLP